MSSTVLTSLTPVAESIDDLDVLVVRDIVPSIAKVFHLVTETFIMLLPDGLQSFCCRWMLVRPLEVHNEYDT
jgi:hypothetical protein